MCDNFTVFMNTSIESVTDNQRNSYECDIMACRLAVKILRMRS
jgi:hypothetical protein